MSNTAAEFIIGSRSIYDLKVVELQKELENLGLRKAGSKNELRTRLRDYLRNNQTEIQSTSEATTAEAAAGKIILSYFFIIHNSLFSRYSAKCGLPSRNTAISQKALRQVQAEYSKVQ